MLCKDYTEYKKIKEHFFKFIEIKGLRKTLEREYLLRVIYNNKGHFDVETLYSEMIKNSYRISRATIYNNISLLLECKIIRELNFDKTQSKYEFIDKNSLNHDHIICTDNSEIIEFYDERINELKKELEQKFNINIYNHSLYFYANKK